MSSKPTDPAALDHEARIDSLLQACSALGIPLARAEADARTRASQLVSYLDAMLEQNQQVNLTGIRDVAQATTLHTLDSVAFAKLGISPRDVLDIGTGNGFPGVGVAALHPAAAVTLCDRTGKKIRAIQAALETADMARVEALQIDAEQAPGLQRTWRKRFDVVVSRAVASCAKLARWSHPMLQPGGNLVLWTTPDTEMPEQPVPAMQLEHVEQYELRVDASDVRTRCLAVYRQA